MRVYDIIAKKRNGNKLTATEIEFLIKGYVQGEIPDYQVSAWLMAVYLKKMEDDETIALTKAMLESGDIVDLSKIMGTKVDKHSTGGVGDKTTLVLGPIVAAGGVPVAKMSGRGLGHTGGTIDKLEAFSGFRVELERSEFLKQVNEIKLAVVGQSGNLVPADKKLYALRDVTATVSSIPLIASSIMSKKIAAGADSIVLDVKTGSGAFMQKSQDAKTLAELMVKIGKEFQKNTVAIISNMNQPLGEAIGNALEVKEAIKALKGEGPEDLMELSKVLAGYMFCVGGKTADISSGKKLATEIINSGKALEKLKEFITAQGGNSTIVDNIDLLKVAKDKIQVKSSASGFVKALDTQEIGKAAMILGAGREKKIDKIDLEVGLEVKRKVGDRVDKGDTLAEVYYKDAKKAENACQIIINAYNISNKKIDKENLILDIIQ